MHQYRCKMVKVVDGDTADVDIDLGFGVWLKKQRIRFYGIDTPESRTSDKEEKPYGLAAKAFVLKYLPIGSDQVLVTIKDDATGKFGRILGRFLLNDSLIECDFLDELMIERHLAVSYYGQSKELIAEKHIENRSYVTLPKT